VLLSNVPLSIAIGIRNPVRIALLVTSAVMGVLAASATGADSRKDPMLLTTPNASGLAASFNENGPIERSNPFFQPLGTNGRSCDSCHRATDGWAITPSSVRARFEETAGLDPIFRANDGASSPNADLSTLAARRAAFSLLLTRGLIRVGLAMPANAEFDLDEVDDPYGYASAQELSLFRRPLPSANLKFVNTVMWDGRETFADVNGDCVKGTTLCFAPLHFDLADQANAATTGHAQASDSLTADQRSEIVRFETGLYTAQIFDDRAKYLNAQGAQGGPVELSTQITYFGINDVIAGDYRTGAPFDPRVMRMYDPWVTPAASPGDDGRVVDARRAVARGQMLFNTKRIDIAGVKGLNDELGMAVIPGTCTTCHDTPGAGNHSVPAPLDIGIADGSRATADMPVYVLRHKVSGVKIATTDPGRALITGKWKDIGRFKGPTLRSLAARPPYFHNGFAEDLGAVVDFYNERFAIGLASREREDLIAFLRTL